MGEAKKRGTYEQRKAEAEAKTKWLEQMTRKRARISKWEIVVIAFSVFYVLSIVWILK